MSLQTVNTHDTVDTQVEKVAESRKGAGDVSGVKDESDRQLTVTADATRETLFSTQALPAGVNGDDGDNRKQSYSKTAKSLVEHSESLLK